MANYGNLWQLMANYGKLLQVNKGKFMVNYRKVSKQRNRQTKKQEIKNY